MKENHFSNSYLVYKPATGLMQLVAENYVLSYCANWQAVKMQSYLYHLRLSTWVGFYWKVNTDRKEAYKVVGANFSSLGGALQRINLVVDVVN